MEDLADIWGPVYTVPSSAGRVKYYGVSKGVICRVKSKEDTPLGQAIHCHYFSRLSFFRRKASRLLQGGDDLELDKNDLLLIGAGFRDNLNCRYTRSAFVGEMKPKMTVLGTKESVWKTDTRSVAFTLSKYLGVTVSGTQKLIPQTSLKQHILDKWTTVPSRSNPGILNQYLGVEISHCTGNARRISLKELMISEPIRPILDRQSPNWAQTPWGSALSAALHSVERDDIIWVWKEFKLNRSDMAELVCCALELLDDTGWNERKEFHSALLFNNEEWAVAMSTKLNSWLVALRDTHLTGAYVITNEICIECEVPDHSTSTCEGVKSFPVLQTQFATAKSRLSRRTAGFVLRPFGERFETVERGSPNITLLTTSSLRGIPNLSRHECVEVMNRTGSGFMGNTVYLRASRPSVHGKHELKDRIGDTLLDNIRDMVPRNRTLTQSRFSKNQNSIRENLAGEVAESTSLSGYRSPDEAIPPMQWGTTRVTPSPIKDSENQREPGAPLSTPSNHTLVYERARDWLMRKSPFIDDHPSTRIRPSLWPIQSHDIDDKGNELKQSDIYGQDVYNFERSRNNSLAAYKSGNEDSSQQKSPQSVAKPDCPPAGGIISDIANYGFSEEEELDLDDETARQKYRPPVEPILGG